MKAPWQGSWSRTISPGTPPTGVTKSGNNIGIKGVGQNTMNPRVGFAWACRGRDAWCCAAVMAYTTSALLASLTSSRLSNQPFGLIRLVQPAVNGSLQIRCRPTLAPSPSSFLTARQVNSSRPR